MPDPDAEWPHGPLLVFTEFVPGFESVFREPSESFLPAQVGVFHDDLSPPQPGGERVASRVGHSFLFGFVDCAVVFASDFRLWPGEVGADDAAAVVVFYPLVDRRFRESGFAAGES